MHLFINLAHLKFFCDAVTHKSVTEAAKVNYVTQSTVSQAIAKLEQVLGTKVAKHSRQRFELTEEGKILFEHACSIFKVVQETYDKIHQNRTIIAGSIQFACTNSLGMSFIAPAFRQLQLNYPHVQPHIKLGNIHYIRNALRQNEIEFALVVYDHNFEQFAKHTLKKGYFHLYQYLEASSAVIENGILIDSLDGMHVSKLQEHCFSHKQKLKIQTELGGWEVVARFTEKGIGVGFFPDYLAMNGRYPTIQIYPFDLPPFEYEICAVYNKGNKLSRAAQVFLDQFCLDCDE